MKKCTYGEVPCEDGVRGQGDASTHQGLPKIVSRPPEARGEAWGRFLSPASEGTNPGDTLILDT